MATQTPEIEILTTPTRPRPKPGLLARLKGHLLLGDLFGAALPPAPPILPDQSETDAESVTAEITKIPAKKPRKKEIA